ncbi:hypothetical protein ACFL1X_06060 [Candidatus Hydrogenedentota bacterium]
MSDSFLFISFGVMDLIRDALYGIALAYTLFLGSSLIASDVSTGAIIELSARPVKHLRYGSASSFSGL